MKEVRAFHCPICKKLIEIKNESSAYIKVNGVVVFGEDGQRIASGTDDGPYRICLDCLAKQLKVEHQPAYKSTLD